MLTINAFNLSLTRGCLQASLFNYTRFHHGRKSALGAPRYSVPSRAIAGLNKRLAILSTCLQKTDVRML